MHAQKSHQQSNFFGKEETKGGANDYDSHSSMAIKNKGTSRLEDDHDTATLKKGRDQDLNKIFGPSSKQIKN